MSLLNKTPPRIELRASGESLPPSPLHSPRKAKRRRRKPLTVASRSDVLRRTLSADALRRKNRRVESIRNASAETTATRSRWSGTLKKVPIQSDNK